MPSLSLLRTVLRELTTSEKTPRSAEPAVAMDDPEQVAAYIEASREVGIMSPTYTFHCAQMCEVMRPGETVVDLACGPATQLGMLARLNPDISFIGVDLSEEMLERGRNHIEDLGLSNVELKLGDITDLGSIADGSIDAVVSTMSLHHLPTLEALEATFAETVRILRPGGGLYLADFAHLRSEKSIHYFAYQHAARQPEIFTIDYLNSLRAAFFLDDFRRLTARYFGDRARLFATRPLPLMVAIKSPARRTPKPALGEKLRRIRDRLAPPQRKDFNDLSRLFKLGGLGAPLLR